MSAAYPLQWPKNWPKTEPARKEQGEVARYHFAPIAPAPIIAPLDATVITAGIDHLASAINASWFDLSPAARARTLELEAALSFLRRQLA